MQHLTKSPMASRLERIDQARQAALVDLKSAHTGLVEPWIEQSWQRCLSRGQRTSDRVVFEAVSRSDLQATAESNRRLIESARPVIEQLARAIADTRYFAILTNHHGVVVDVDGVMDATDKRVSAIARVGVDLSEETVGTTAIGAALRELRPVWLHRGEHFFKDNAVYSCAGAPLFGPQGQCVGMLDLTGVETSERPELRHLVAQSVRSIENALVNQQAHTLLLRINWPGTPLGLEGDGLLGLDGDGQVLAANQAARLLLPELVHMPSQRIDCRDLFATPFEHLLDAAVRQQTLETPLWSGLRVQVHGTLHERRHASRPSQRPADLQGNLPLKDLETSLILQSVEAHKGNVAQAARALGISRATVYRKLKTKR
jgi:transcriptional regulator of acetoin/glycerol metabolism